jgi:hypothetical protein
MSGVKVTGYNYASSQLPKIAWEEVESAGPFFALLLDPPLRPKESDGRVYGKGYVTIDDVQVIGTCIRIDKYDSHVPTRHGSRSAMR